MIYSALGADPDTEGFIAYYDLERESFTSSKGATEALHLFPCAGSIRRAGY